MKNQELLELLNIRDRRVTLYKDNFLNIVYKNNMKINKIKAKLSYLPKHCYKCKSSNNNLIKNGFDTVKIKILI